MATGPGLAGDRLSVSPMSLPAPSAAHHGLVVVDTSAYAQIKHVRSAAERFTNLSARGLVATCSIIFGEVLFSMPDRVSLQTMQATMEGLWYLPLTEWAEARALEVFGGLAEHGKHRACGIGDLQIAAVAEQYAATVLHYDQDFDAIAEVTGQPTEWIVPRGMGHRGGS